VTLDRLKTAMVKKAGALVQAARAAVVPVRYVIKIESTD